MPKKRERNESTELERLPPSGQEPVDQPDTGRVITEDSSPEGRQMQLGTFEARESQPEHAEDQQSVFDELDDRAARDVRMQVRQREHSAD